MCDILTSSNKKIFILNQLYIQFNARNQWKQRPMPDINNVKGLLQARGSQLKQSITDVNIYADMYLYTNGWSSMRFSYHLQIIIPSMGV